MVDFVKTVLFLSMLGGLASCAEHPRALSGPAVADSSQFVSIEDGRFKLGRQAYCFVGTNLWYGAYLGAKAPVGDRHRLERELDALAAAGITNLRVLGASENSPLRDAVSPAFRDRTGQYNDTLLEGLDVLLDEMSRRNMKAVIYLNNFWEWSGGMATYLYWTNGGRIVDPSDPNHPWPAFAEFTAGFYSSEAAQRLFEDYVRALVTRRNTVNGRTYADDPTIMSWQLANEPRPGYRNGRGYSNLPNYHAWIDRTAKLIRSLDSKHLVSTGSEGTMGCLQSEACFRDAHASEYIDYLTFHMWPKNWSWLDAGDMPGTFGETLRNASDYLDLHLRIAREQRKPIVLEEFGLDRDGGSTSSDSPVSYRDEFFAFVFRRVESSLAERGPLAGTNFWTWGGLGRPEHADHRWRAGDTIYTGDPPQEPQGLNSVFNSDASTLELIRTHAEQLRATACGMR